MSVASKLITIAENLRAKLDAINVKLTAKGQTEAANFDEVPAKIEAIETKKQDVLNLVSGITKYTDSFEINGELRSNVLVQPSDFSDESTITWSSSANNYFSHSIENIEGSENGSVMVLNPVRTTETSVYNLFWFNSTVNASTSESRTYLIAVRAKASETITSYFPNMAITYYPTGSTGSNFLYFSYTPTTEWQTFYVIANIPENYYLKDITMCFCSRGITHYIDWIAAYDITGTDFDHMTFGAKATATTSDVLSGKTFYKDGVCYTGTIATKTQAMPNINVSPTGLITASATQSAGYVSSGTKEATKQLSTKSATTYTPSTNNQTISSGYYLTGTQTIKGDSNLVASNIKSGVSIFGVNGTYTSNYHEFWGSGIIYSNNYTFTITLQDLSADKCIIRMFIRSSASVINSGRIACLDFDAISNVRLQYMTNNDRWRTAQESDFTWSRTSNDTYTLTISSSLGSLRTDDQYQFLAVYADGTNWKGYYKIV